jgi:hypothetical protein
MAGFEMAGVEMAGFEMAEGQGNQFPSHLVYTMLFYIAHDV